MLVVQAILKDRSVAPKFMTDDPSEAEETRSQMLIAERVAEVGILEEPDGKVFQV
ncbi:MAG TPA: hypothetical protein VK673_13150 [Chthoniobacterales bacterium]|nr:hypothetical protein [Chthoniobacterales bacterium]